MQISKTLLTCGAAALCLVATSARSADAADDQKLRDALHQRMAEVGPETPEPVKPTKVKTPKPPKAPKTPKAQAPTSTPVANEPTPTAPPVVQSAPAPAAPVAPASPADEQARLREAVRVRLAAENPPPPTQPEAPAAAPVVSTPAAPAPAEPAPVVTNGSDLQPAVSSTTIVTPAPAAPAPTPVTPPASPLSGSKEQRLATLLQQYKSDQITPQQYHEQRAKILAE